MSKMKTLMELEDLKDDRDIYKFNYNKADRDFTSSAFGLLIGLILFLIYGFSLIGGFGIFLFVAGAFGAITQMIKRSSASKDWDKTEEEVREMRQLIIDEENE